MIKVFFGMYQGHPAETRRFAARPFLTFGALWAKSPGQDPICVFDTRPFFSLGRRRPKPVPFHFIPYRSTLPASGRVKPNPRLLRLRGFGFTGCRWKPICVLFRKLYTEGGAFGEFGVSYVDLAFVVFGDNTFGQREAQTPSALLGGIARIEYAAP